MKLKEIILSWDLLAALIATGFAYYFLPVCVSNELANSFYAIGISVLSITFSVYFAALAIILASSSDDFVKFLEKNNNYSDILIFFRYTLGALFVGLVYSIVASMVTTFLLKSGGNHQSHAFVCLFVFLFFYGIFCSYNSAKDAILYSVYRMRFLKKGQPPSDKTTPPSNQ